MPSERKRKTPAQAADSGDAEACASSEIKQTIAAPSLSNGVRSIMQQYSSLSVTTFGKIRDSLTGHEMPAREDVIRQVR
jgi:hypothetical protein